MDENKKTLSESIIELTSDLEKIKEKGEDIAMQATEALAQQGAVDTTPFIITGLTVFVLACFVGYHVVWRVTPALHSPLMGITNAISSVIIVGALMAASPMVVDLAVPTAEQSGGGFSQLLGFLAIILASVNIFGGFIITRRMLHMFRKKG